MVCEIYGYSCEGVGAISSAAIAVFAFFTTTWQAITTRKHNRLSVKPMLSTWTTTAPDRYTFKLSNIGVGPALIKSFHVYVDDKKIDGTGTEPIAKAVHILFPQNPPQILNCSYLTKGGALSANFGIDVADLLFPPTALPSPAVLEHLQKRIKLVVEYTSIYEEKTYSYDSYKNHHAI